MKNIITIGLLCWALSTQAQKGKVGLAIGLKGEIAYTAFKENLENSVYTPGFGYGFGGFVRAKIFKFYFQPELNYSNQSVYVESKTVDGKNKISFSAVDVPVMLGLYLFKVERTSVRLFVGPELTVFGSYKVKDETIDKKKAGIRAGFGAYTFGVGIDVGRLTMDARYKSAFTSISSLSNVDMMPNQVILSLGIKIHHKEGL